MCGFFYAVVASDGEVQSTHPSYAPNAARIGLHNAVSDEHKETDFPRVMTVQAWHSCGLGGRITRKRDVPDAELNRLADEREAFLKTIR